MHCESTLLTILYCALNFNGLWIITRAIAWVYEWFVSNQPNGSGQAVGAGSPCPPPIMQINKIFRPPVGADLSCPSPIYRPSEDVPNIRIILLNAIIGPIDINSAYTICPGSNGADYREYSGESAAKQPPSESLSRNNHLARQTTACLQNDVSGTRSPP